jgi:UDP-N-acetylmuramoyl-tripeptide--D-alanyl-D-alanine ligase
VPELTAGFVAEASGGVLVGDATSRASSVVHDSRRVTSDVAFVSVRGDAFVAGALDAGAPFVIVERRDVVPDGATAVVTDDSVLALGKIAKAVRARSRWKVVGITGSTGKTLTKDLTAAVLSAKYKVHAAPNSFNAELGVPLVVLSCPDDTQVIVAELAARHLGNIAYLTDIVRPETGVVTGIGVTHIAEFGSRDAGSSDFVRAIASLPSDGLAVLPSGDDYLAFLVASTHARVRTVGPGATVRYRAERIDGDGHTHGTVTIDDRSVAIDLAVPGRALLRNAAMALAVGAEYGVDPDDGARAIANATLSSWRMQISRLHAWTIVNDAWNSSPTSILSALHSAKEMSEDAPVWAVLGGMAELGEIAPAEHLRAGRLVAALGYAGVITVGDAARDIARGAGAIAVEASDKEEAAAIARDRVPDGATVLVKASRSFGLEHFPDILKASTEAVRTRREGAPPDRRP